MRFKPGDKARVVGNTDCKKFSHVVPKGSEVEIIEHYTVKKPFDRYKVKWNWEGGISATVLARDLEPLPSVQEEESPWIDIGAMENLQFEMHKTVDMICEKTKVSYQDAANVYFLATIAQLSSTISRLKSELEELKRKA